MTIETKHYLGQPVYFMESNRVQESRIIEIIIKMMLGYKETEQVKVEGGKYLDNVDYYFSKEELLKSL